MKHILITALVFALGFVATSAQADDMLYNDLGGEKGIATIVDNATAAFLADPRIKDTFQTEAGRATLCGLRRPLHLLRSVDGRRA